MIDIENARGLYAIVDPEFCLGRAPLEIAQAILDGGCAVMQLRAKRLAAGDLEALARSMLQICSARGVPFVVNDHAELASRIGAAGVHLGQSDAPIERVRERTGAQLRIGLSTHDLQQARDAHSRGADLIGFGPVFATRSKLNPDPLVGLEGLREVCRTVCVPVVAIGGIGLHNAQAVAACGPALIAAIGALCSASDPRAAASALHQAAQSSKR